MLEQERVHALKRDYLARLIQRRKEFRIFWDAHLAEVDADQRPTMPAFLDVVLSPSTSAMLEEDDAQTEVTEGRWNSRKDLILLDVEAHRLKVKCDLLRLLKGENVAVQGDMDGDIDMRSDDCDEENEFDMLSDPTALFACNSLGCRQLIGYPALLQHSYVFHGHLEWKPGRFRYEFHIQAMVAAVLKAVGLSQTTTQADLINLDGRFVCLCGNPNFQDPTTFSALVRISFISHSVPINSPDSI
jgi:hypothetical protein